MIRNLLLALALPSLSFAGLLGDTVTVKYDLFGAVISEETVVVGAGPEITCPGPADICVALTLPTQTIDIGDNFITYLKAGIANGSFNSGLGFSGFRFSSLDHGAPVASIAFDTNIAGLDLTRVSFTDTTFDINMEGLDVSADGSFFTVTFNPVTPIPEPSTWAMGLTAVGAIAALRRFRRA
jgi:hypothetical protein